MTKLDILWYGPDGASLVSESTPSLEKGDHFCMWLVSGIFQFYGDSLEMAFNPSYKQEHANHS